MIKIYSLIICIVLFPIIVFSKIIVIDPGHDYEDVLSGYRTDTEVNTNWAVANKLVGFIEQDPYLDWDAVLTRNENEDDGYMVSVYERAEYANIWESNYPGEVYFLSIHCNALDGELAGTADGTESFYCNYTFNSNNNLLKRYANNINNYIIEYGEMKDRDRCVEDESYYGFHLAVLKELRMPNCLNEIGFVRHIEDKFKLLDDGYRDIFAWAYFEAFKATFSGIEIVSYSFENLPCYAENENFVKINVTIENVTNHSYYGDVRAVLRHFPTFELDEITNDFCYLGNSQHVYLSPGQQYTLSFSANVPYTMEVGMALCIEANQGARWENVPMPSHKRIIRVPMNGARITGVVYSSDINPLNGVEIWSYQYPSNKSANLYSDIFDPTRAVTNIDGRYELLIPADWEEAVISAWNYINYDEVYVSPIANMNLVHYYTSDPIAVGVGSGSGNCGAVSGQSPDDPNEILQVLDKFEFLGINEQPRVAFVREDEQLKLGVFPKPVNYSKTQLYSCGGTVKELVVYFSDIDCYVPASSDWNGNDLDYYLDYRLTISEIDEQNNQIGNEETMYFIEPIESVEVNRTRIGDIDVKNCLAQMGWQLQNGKRYQLKFGYTDNILYPGFYLEKEVILNVYLNYLELDDTNLTGSKYTADNITLKNANIPISSELVLLASNQIIIQPGTYVKGILHAAIGSEKSSIVKSKTTKSSGLNNTSFLSGSMTESNRFVSSFSNNCPCSNLINNEIRQEFMVEIYPNPVKNKLILFFNQNFQGKVNILSLKGEFIYEYIVEGNYYAIPLQNLSPGEYIIKVENNHKIFTSKFIKI